MRLTLSVLGLYQAEPTLFDELVLPAGVDKTVLVNHILMEAAPLEVYYPDPNFMKKAIGNWSARNQYTWKKLNDTLSLEYNPIHNYDRTEEWMDDEKRNLTGNDSERRNDTETRNLSRDSTVDTDSNSTANTNVSGYNDDTLVPRESVGTNGNTHGTDTTTNTGTINRDDSLTRTRTDNETRQNARTGRAYGNIGVTTTQQMINAEREVAQFSIYNYITEAFIKVFCLEVF